MKKVFTLILGLTITYFGYATGGGGKGYSFVSVVETWDNVFVTKCLGSGTLTCPTIIRPSNGGVEIDRVIIDNIVIDKLKNKEEVSILCFQILQYM